jgi:hypothetical protein
MGSILKADDFTDAIRIGSDGMEDAAAHRVDLKRILSK